jgi:hypothetical protein
MFVFNLIFLPKFNSNMNQYSFTYCDGMSLEVSLSGGKVEEAFIGSFCLLLPRIMACIVQVELLKIFNEYQAKTFKKSLLKMILIVHSTS